MTKRFTRDVFEDGVFRIEKIIDNADEICHKKTYDAVDLLNSLNEENVQLRQQLKNIEDNFEFCCTENQTEFNKDEINVRDTHTELALKDGKLYLSVFIPKINEYFKFCYMVTGRRMEREFINYDGDVK